MTDRSYIVSVNPDTPSGEPEVVVHPGGTIKLSDWLWSEAMQLRESGDVGEISNDLDDLTSFLRIAYNARVAPPRPVPEVVPIATAPEPTAEPKPKRQRRALS